MSANQQESYDTHVGAIDRYVDLVQAGFVDNGNGDMTLTVPLDALNIVPSGETTSGGNASGSGGTRRANSGQGSKPQVTVVGNWLIVRAVAALIGARIASSPTAQQEIASLIQLARQARPYATAQASSLKVGLQAAQQWVGMGARVITDQRTREAVGQINADGSRVWRWNNLTRPDPYLKLVTRNPATGAHTGNLHVRIPTP